MMFYEKTISLLSHSIFLSNVVSVAQKTLLKTKKIVKFHSENEVFCLKINTFLIFFVGKAIQTATFFLFWNKT